MDLGSRSDCKIAAVGGGIGGLAVGIALLECGFGNVTVYERDSSVEGRRQGYGLTILQGISALKRLGILEEVKKRDTPSRTHFIFKKDGTLIGFFGTAFWDPPARRHNLHIPRQELRKILLDRYIELHPKKAAGIKWDCRITSIDRQSNCIHFQNGSVEKGLNLIIGADGINGPCRSFKYPRDGPPNYLGIVVVLGITRSDHFLAHDRVFETMDGFFRLFAMPFSKTDPSQAVMWQLSFPCALDDAVEFSRDLAALRLFLVERFENWHAPVPDMIRSTPLDKIMGIPAFDRDPGLPPDEAGGLPMVLIGDAAHPMSPFKGQGANQALLDAVELADALRWHLNVSVSFSEIGRTFETSMLKRVRQKVLQSRERASSLHQPGILQTENFIYRGVDEGLIHGLNQRNINANWNGEQPIEEAIKACMVR